MSYGIDKILPPISITAANNTLVVTGSSTSNATATIPANTYWSHRDTTLDLAGYNSLFLAIETAVNAVLSLSGPIVFSAATPVQSSQQTNGGLQCISSVGTSIEFNITHGSWTFPFELLGEVDNAVVSKSDWGGSSVITSDYCRSGDWHLYNLYSESTRGADDKRSHVRFNQFVSDDDPLYAYSYDWNEDANGDQLRKYMVSNIPAAHVIGNRALESDYASSSQLAHGDTNQGFVEHVWERARTLSGEGVDSDIIIVHNDNTDLLVSSHDYDIVRMADRSQRMDWLDSGLFSLRRKNGEYYDLNMKLRIKTKFYSH